MSDYSPDPLWSMATTPDETFEGWANERTKTTYDEIMNDAVRAQGTRELAASCISTGWLQARQHPSSVTGRDRWNARSFAIDEFARRLELDSDVVDCGQLLDAFLES